MLTNNERHYISITPTASEGMKGHTAFLQDRVQTIDVKFEDIQERNKLYDEYHS